MLCALGITSGEDTAFKYVSGTISGIVVTQTGRMEYASVIRTKQRDTQYFNVETGAYRDDQISYDPFERAYSKTVKIYDPESRMLKAWTFDQFNNALQCVETQVPSDHCAPLDCMAEKWKNAEYEGEDAGLKHWKLTQGGVSFDVGVDPTSGLITESYLSAPESYDRTIITFKMTEQEAGAPDAAVFEAPLYVADGVPLYVDALKCVYITPSVSLLAQHVEKTLFFSPSPFFMEAPHPTNGIFATSASTAAFVGIAVGALIASATLIVYRKWKEHVFVGMTPLLA